MPSFRHVDAENIQKTVTDIPKIIPIKDLMKGKTLTKKKTHYFSVIPRICIEGGEAMTNNA